MEVNSVNSSINSFVITQSENPRVFNEGRDKGSGNRAEKRWDTPVTSVRVTVLRVGNHDGSKIMGGSLRTRWSS